MTDKKTIGRYEIIKHLAQGGMGEVFLAFDPTCSRNVALKRIREDLKDKPTIRQRFLKEARIASQLTHPSIVPIYSIHEDEDSVYYTMPYVEGKTLKDILVEAVKMPSSESSIPNLIRVFLAVCEAMAFVHSKKILHRDLKPSNILVGKYGEVLILDWGIANYLNEIEAKNQALLEKKSSQDELKTNEKKLPHPNKIAGTITYLAPECVLGEYSSVLSDVYALGVILYQILTLRSPFRRTSVADFRKKAKLEKTPDPALAAPYRDIPLALSKITKKCLYFDKKERYQTIEALLKDLKNYIEGNPEWMLKGELDLKDPKAFIFQENIYLPKTLESSDWASVWLAKATLSGSFKISFEFLLKEKSSGLGVLFSIPEHSGKYIIEDGFLVFFGPKKKPYIELSHGSILVLRNQNIALKKRIWHKVKIEKLGNTIRCYLNDILVLSYISYIPLFGSHLGLFFKDNAFLISNFKLFAASNNLLVSCLALPDAFLSKKDFDAAYLEYKRIAASFPGRTEEREALFRAGITILEKAKTEGDKELFEQALLEFENLKTGAGAPLEYLGKSIVYATLKEYEEEAKCLELAIRRFQDHPLISLLKEHLLLRLHESSFAQREAHLRLMLVSQLIFLELNKLPDTELLTQNLQKHLLPLEFLIPSKNMLIIDLAFRLDKKMLLLDLLEKLDSKKEEDALDIFNILISLLEMGTSEEVSNLINQDPLNQDRSVICSAAVAAIKETLKIIEGNFTQTYAFKNKKLDSLTFASLLFLLKTALKENNAAFITNTLQKLDLEELQLMVEPKVDQKESAININPKTILTSYQIWAYLLEKKLSKAEELFKGFSEEQRADEQSPLFIPYGLFLHLKGEEEVAKLHFTAPLDTLYPSMGALFGLIVTGKGEKWREKLLPYERRELRELLEIYTELAEKSLTKSFFKF